MHWLIWKTTGQIYIFSTNFMKEKGLFLRERKLLLYSLFIKHWVYEKLKYILPNYVSNIGHIKRLICCMETLLLFSVLSKKVKWKCHIMKWWKENVEWCPRQHTSEIDFYCIYHDLVILFEAEPNFLVSTYEIDCCMKVIAREKGRKLQEDWKYYLLKRLTERRDRGF